MDDKSYFMIDGSCLFSAIREVRKNKDFKDKKLDLGQFTNILTSEWSIYTSATIRVVYYFRKDDARIRDLLIIPDSSLPGLKNHWRIKQCGEKLPTVPEDELEKLKQKYRSIFPRAEKGLDIQLVCDTLQLVATDKAGSIVVFANDTDYLPFFETLQNLGVNIYLAGLTSKKKVSKKLTDLADAYLTLDEHLNKFFI